MKRKASLKAVYAIAGRFFKTHWQLIVIAIIPIGVSAYALHVNYVHYEELNTQYEQSSELQQKRYDELNTQYEQSLELQQKRYDELNTQYEQSLELQQKRYEELGVHPYDWTERVRRVWRGAPLFR